MIADATAPASPVSVWLTTYPLNLQQGTAPVNVTGWDALGQGPAGQKRKVYLSLWIQLVSTSSAAGDGYEGHPASNKFGFMAYGDSISAAQNQGVIIGRVANSGGQPQVVKSLALQFHQQGPVNRILAPNTGVSGQLVVGPWHHWEVLWELNSGPDVPDGVFQFWQDGKLVFDHADVVYLTPGKTNGFHGYKWNPTWGGNTTGVKKSRADFVRIDHVYLSGVKL